MLVSDIPHGTEWEFMQNHPDAKFIPFRDFSNLSGYRSNHRYIGKEGVYRDSSHNLVLLRYQTETGQPFSAVFDRRDVEVIPNDTPVR